MPVVIDTESQRIFDGLVGRILPKPEWTHEAHVRACHVALADRTPAEALAFLRPTIRAYNEATGVVNSDDSGYHETITRYYVHAVARLADQPIDRVLADPSVARDAPLRHWSREALFSVEARAGWTEPDRAPLDRLAPSS